MAVNVSAKGQGGAGISLGGNFNLGQFDTTSPATWSAGLMLVLLVIIVLMAISLR